MGWAETFQNNIDQWNQNVGIVKQNVEDLNANLQAVGLQPKPADEQNASPIKTSMMEQAAKNKWWLIGAAVLIVVVLLGKKMKIKGL